MVRREPSVDRPHTYECYACGFRVEADQQPVTCSACGGEMRNVSKPQT